MRQLFDVVNEILGLTQRYGALDARTRLMGSRILLNRRREMAQEAVAKGVHDQMSPLSAVTMVPTDSLLLHLAPYEQNGYQIGGLLRQRPQTAIYQVDAAFRGDPYPGALAAIDYLRCREGKTFEERRHNLVLAFGKVTPDRTTGLQVVNTKGASINDFVAAVQGSASKNLLTKDWSQLKPEEIPRYYMQARYGSTFSKVKHIRVFSYFADAILFPDGALWRDG
jgi:hypothetical protein